MFEQFLTADENWQQSAIMMNVRQKKKGSRHGKYVWKRYDHVVENEESESETEFELGQEIGLSSSAAASALRSALGGSAGSNDRGQPSNLPPAPNQNPPRPREKKEKTVSQEAWNLLKGSMVKVTEADGLKAKLQASGMYLVYTSITTQYLMHAHTHDRHGNTHDPRGAQFVDALLADADDTVQLLKGTYHTLKDAISSHAADDHKKFCCDELSGALKQWDSKMKAIRKAMPSNTPKASSAKAKAKGKAGK
eukprot:s1222_g11.t1